MCVPRKRVFCYYCLQCYQKGAAKKYDSAFILHGFQNWKKGRERLECHEKSGCHREAVLKLKGMQGQSPIALLSSEARRTQANHRRMLLKQLSSLKFLLRQGLSIRGHKESEGNLIQLFELQSNDCPELKQWLLSNHYLSHDIVITLMGNTLLRQIYEPLDGFQ